MTLLEMKELQRDVLTCTEVSSILKCSEQTLHLQAQKKPDTLGFPVICIGNRVKIPRIAFIRYMEGIEA